MNPSTLATLQHIASGLRAGHDANESGVTEFYLERLEDLLRREDGREERVASLNHENEPGRNDPAPHFEGWGFEYFKDDADSTVGGFIVCGSHNEAIAEQSRCLNDGWNVSPVRRTEYREAG